MNRATGGSGLAGPVGDRILVVEDFDLLRTLMVRVLRAQGHQVIGVGTATAAISHLVSEQVDLLVIDLKLPGGRGIDTVRWAVAVNPRVRILLTAESVSSRPDLEVTGTDVAVLAKPFDIDALSARVRELLAGSPDRPGDTNAP